MEFDSKQQLQPYTASSSATLVIVSTVHTETDKVYSITTTATTANACYQLSSSSYQHSFELSNAIRELSFRSTYSSYAFSAHI